MAKKKEPEKEANHERWLVSFADFMTLLFALFVVLFANSQSDSERLEAVSQSFQSAMSRFSIWPEPGGKGISLISSTNIGGGEAMTVVVSPETGGLTPVTVEADTAVESDAFDDGSSYEDEGDPNAWQTGPEVPDEGPEVQQFGGVGDANSPEMQQIFEELNELLRGELDSLDIKEEKRGIVISLGESGFFDSGSAELKRSSMVTISRIARKLKSLLDKRNILIRIEGHTDNIPLNPASPYIDNWGLSTARANAVLRIFLNRYGFPMSNMVSQGYGASRPIASNLTEPGRAQNRRVEIVLLSNEFAEMESTGRRTQ